MKARAGLAALLAAAAVLLGGCSAPEHWAVRLNPDGTGDYVDCAGPVWMIRVDYLTGDEPGEEWDWDVRVPAGAEDVDPVILARYGEVPAGWEERIPAQEPPADWVSVNTTSGYAQRSELVEGTWVWFTGDEHLQWAGDHPCDGWEVGPDGDPRPVA